MSSSQQSERQISHQPTASAVTQEPSRSQVIQPQPVTDETANRQRQRQRFDSFRRPLVVGKRCLISDESGTTVMAAKPYKAVFCIDNVSSSVDTASLTSFVSSLGVRVLSCFEVKPRKTARQRLHGVQASHKTFRLCINRADDHTLLNADLWPSDVSIFKWFFKQSVTSENAQISVSEEHSGTGTALHSDAEDMDATLSLETSVSEPTND